MPDFFPPQDPNPSTSFLSADIMCLDIESLSILSMDILEAIRKISVERREILVAAFQNIQPGGFLQTLLDQVRLLCECIICCRFLAYDVPSAISTPP
jgi:hypothetical protein